MNHRHFPFIFLAALLSAGCNSDANTDTSRSIPADTAVPVSDSAIVPDAPVRYSKEHRYDLTGDSQPERFTVTASGADYDSLDVLLRIYSSADSLLYAHGWTSRLYFVYTPLEGKSDEEVRQIVLGHLQDLLSDSAFSSSGREQGVDSEAVDFDVREEMWRQSHGFTDTMNIPAEAWDTINSITPPADRLRELVAELQGMPTFTYFAGGEFTSTIAWSKREHRFVTIFACC